MRCLSYRRLAVRSRRRVVLCLFAAVLPLSPLVRPAEAQGTLSGEIAVMGANALLGGVTSGVGGWLRGESFLESFGAGALGGSVVYAGKRIAATHVPGAGAVGRAVGSVGSSIVLNGSSGRGLLETVVLPVGPVNLYRRQSSGEASWSARLNLGRAVYLGWTLLRDDRELDWTSTFSAGTPVFIASDTIMRAESGDRIGGNELWGAIWVTDPMETPEFDPARILAHEQVHVVQDDFLNITWANPIEQRLLGRLPGGETIGRFVEPGVAYIAMIGPMVLMLPYHDRPWEVEASYMGRGW